MKQWIYDTIFFYICTLELLEWCPNSGYLWTFAWNQRSATTSFISWNNHWQYHKDCILASCHAIHQAERTLLLNPAPGTKSTNNCKKSVSQSKNAIKSAKQTIISVKCHIRVVQRFLLFYWISHAPNSNYSYCISVTVIRNYIVLQLMIFDESLSFTINTTSFTWKPSFSSWWKGFLTSKAMSTIVFCDCCHMNRSYCETKKTMENQHKQHKKMINSVISINV